MVPELPYRHILSRPATNLGAELLRFVKVTEVIDETQARVRRERKETTNVHSGILLGLRVQWGEYGVAVVPSDARSACDANGTRYTTRH